MKNTLVTSLVSLVVALVPVGITSASPKPTKPNTLQPNTITQTEIQEITKQAITRTDEAAVCIQSLYAKLPETALGYCFSWKLQALDAKEIATADFWVKVAAKSIADGIANERI